MIGTEAILAFEIANALIPLAMAALFIALIAHNAKRCDVESIPRFLLLARWFLVASFLFVLLVASVNYAFGRWFEDLGSFLLYGFVALPLFFMFAYLVGALWMNVLLHMVIRRYRREGRSVDDVRVSHAVRKTVAPFRWLHTAMSGGSSTRFAEMLDDVCPEEDR